MSETDDATKEGPHSVGVWTLKTNIIYIKYQSVRVMTKYKPDFRVSLCYQCPAVKRLKETFCLEDPVYMVTIKFVNAFAMYQWSS